MPVSYPLNTLLTLRQEIKKRCEQRLAEATAELQAAEENFRHALAQVQTQKDSIVRVQKEWATQEPGSIKKLQWQERYLHRLNKILERKSQGGIEAQIQRDQQQKVLVIIQQDLLQAVAALKAVERNHEIWDQARREKAERRAEQELDDLVLARQRRPG